MTNDELTASVESCERAALCGAIAVIAGLVIEVVLAIHQTFTTISWDSSEGTWGAVIADSLVALGVSAEVFFSRLGLSRQRELQRRSDDKVTAATKAAGEAHERAAQIEKFTAWRRITQEQHDAMGTVLREIAPSIDVFIEFQNGDAEAFWYARALATVFVNAGAPEPHGGPNMLLSPNIVFGVLVTVHPGVSAEIISKAFTDGGIAFEMRPFNPIMPPKKQPPPNLDIFVAAKAPPALPLIATSANPSNPTVRE